MSLELALLSLLRLSTRIGNLRSLRDNAMLNFENLLFVSICVHSRLKIICIFSIIVIYYLLLESPQWFLFLDACMVSVSFLVCLH